MNPGKIIFICLTTAAMLCGIFLTAAVVEAGGYGIDREYGVALLCFFIGMTAKYTSTRAGRIISLLSSVCLVATLAWVWTHMIIHRKFGLDFVFLLMAGGLATWLAPFAIINYSRKKILTHLLLFAAGIGLHVAYRYWGPELLRDDLFSAAMVWTVAGLIHFSREVYVAHFETLPIKNR